jgi:hypothetical protein
LPYFVFKCDKSNYKNMSEYELPESPIIVRMADLRQAVEWIAFGFKPIP